MTQTIKIKSNDRMSNTRFHAAGKPNWWLRNVETSEFVTIPRTRGDDYFEATLDLEPGRYVLGVGPRDKFGKRINVTVKA